MTACKILVLEDDNDDVLLLKRALQTVAKRRNLPLAIQHSRNGFEGLCHIGRSDLLSALPDVVVVDLNMPTLDGMAFLKSLRGPFGLKDVYAAVLTTSAETVIHDAALRAGADRVFSKPDTFSELLNIAEVVVAAAVAADSAHPRAPGGGAR
jgi:two-component system, chemotaxis family, chemotaxis protein CheY